MGQLSDAQRFLDDGLRRQPESAMGEFLQGSLEFRTGILPEAELALQQAVQLDPTLAQPRLPTNKPASEGRKKGRRRRADPCVFGRAPRQPVKQSGEATVAAPGNPYR